MKKLFFLIGLFISIATFSQNKSTTATLTVSVKGNCDQCKERIENAADIKGVKICKWSEKTQVATITYNPEKVTPEQIKEAIAKAGHDVEGVKAPDASYKKLPDCCQYRDKACETKK